MELQNLELKKFKVSIILMKNPTLKNIYINKKIIPKRSGNSKNLLNFYSQNNIQQYKPNKLFSTSIKKPLGLDLNKDIKFQTGISSSHKKFQTPYQIFHLKNKMLKDIFDYSKISHKNSYIQQQIKVNKKIVNIMPYTASKKNTREYRALTPKFNYVKLNNFKNNERTFNGKRFLKKNKTVNNHIKPEMANSSTQTFNKINFNDNNKVVNLASRKEYNNKKKNIIKQFKLFKPNCYYNKLNLEKLSNILRKYSFADI